MKLTGNVIEGDGYGRQIGFPTANIDRDDYQEQNPDLAYGIYAGLVTLDGSDTAYKAGIVVGPEDAWGLPKLEAHLIDFSGDLYGETITMHLLHFLHAYESYDSEDALKEGIAADIETIKNTTLCLPE